MTAAKPVYLCAPRRTPIGSFSGALSTVPAPRLGAAVIRAVVAECGVPGEAIDGAIFGCVLTAGQGQAPTRQAVLYSGLPNTVQAMTVNKVCSSGLVALTLAANEIRLGLRQAVVAGGMESMSLAPYLAPKLRSGARLGHTQMLDSILADGLWDVYKDVHMGVAGELCAKKFSLDRNAQDQFALESYRRANQAIASGAFAEELVAVEVGGAKHSVDCAVDEEPAKLKPEKMAQLKPAFDPQGTVTAGNASSLSDGAAGMLVCSEEFVKTHNLRPLARLVEQGWHAQEPEWFTTAPVGAVRMVLRRAGIAMDAIDLFEINEAFSSVALACAHSLDIDHSRLNVCGGAVALGHPIGASGARIVTTLVRSLHRLNKRYGVAAICNGGGEATSLLVERI